MGAGIKIARLVQAAQLLQRRGARMGDGAAVGARLQRRVTCGQRVARAPGLDQRPAQGVERAGIFRRDADGVQRVGQRVIVAAKLGERRRTTRQRADIVRRQRERSIKRGGRRLGLSGLQLRRTGDHPDQRVARPARQGDLQIVQRRLGAPHLQKRHRPVSAHDRMAGIAGVGLQQRQNLGVSHQRRLGPLQRHLRGGQAHAQFGLVFPLMRTRRQTGLKGPLGVAIARAIQVSRAIAARVIAGGGTAGGKGGQETEEKEAEARHQGPGAERAVARLSSMGRAPGRGNGR